MKILLFVALTAFLPMSDTIDIPEYTFEEFEPYLHKNDGKVYIINFWATWCKPCIEELPAFEKLDRNSDKNRLEVVMVSLDFPEQAESRLNTFLEKNHYGFKVILLNDPNSNQWIDKVDPSWSGGIPATLIYKNDQRIFHEGIYTFEKLKNEVEGLEDER